MNLTTQQFPFIFLNHGEINLEYVNKNTECYIWFGREVTAVERKLIVETCPPPLSGLFVWGECFAYFGSGGDTYDFDIVETYAGKKICEKLNKIMMAEEFDEDEENDYEPYMEDRSGSFPEIKMKSIDFSDFDNAFSDLLSVCVPRMSSDMDNWAKQINQVIPVEFIKGPHGVEDEDDWNTWSFQQLDMALNTIIGYIEKRKNDFSNVQQKNIPSESNEPSNSYKLELLPYSERIRYFGYIFNDIISKYSSQTEDKKISAEEREKRLKLADLIYNLDEITDSFDRLSIEEHNIQHNSHIIVSALHGLSPQERISEIEKLHSYTQLAYYASYDALKANDLLTYSNPKKILENLIEKIPVHRQKSVTSILSMIAHNLIHVTPAYKIPDKKYSKEASEIFTLICNRKDATEKDFITGTVCCEWANNPNQGTIIAEIGLRIYTKSKQLIHNSISVYNLCNNHKRANELLAIYESILDKPDENFILNKSFNLIKTNEHKEAKEILEKYLEQGGEKTPNILVNLIYVWRNQIPDKSVLDKYLVEITELIKGNSSYQADNLLENFLGLTSSQGYNKETIELGDYLFEKNGNIPPNCWVNYTYAAFFMEEYHQKVVTKMDSLLPELENHLGKNPMSFANLACIYVKLKNKDRAINYLKLCKKHKHPAFSTFITDEDFKPLWKDAEFLKLFN